MTKNLHSLLNRLFTLEERGSTVSRELRGAVATFLTMAYILFANPGILSITGIPFAPAMAATALAAGVTCIMMGLFANFPLALASGMGLNAVVAFNLTATVGSWQKAMGIIVLDGIVMVVLVLCGVREAMMRAIPQDLRRAIGAGIGLFIAFIGAVNCRLVVVSPGTIAALVGKDPLAVNPLPPVSFGSLHNPATAIAVVGLVLISFLLARRVTGAIVLGIIACSILGHIFGLTTMPAQFRMPSFPLPSFETVFQADVMGVLLNPVMLVPLLIPILLVDFFDTLGTVTAIAEQGNLFDERGEIPRLKPILIIDSLAASIGGLLGVSSVTCYIESAAGVAEGARTGLHSVFVGLFFLAAIFLAPLASLVPDAATAPALIIVGFLMCEQLTKIDFANLEIGIPAFVTFALMPFTYSITHGIGYGFITYTVMKILRGQFKDVHPLMYGAAAIFAGYFILG